MFIPKKLFEILFASIDETLDHLKPENRKLVEMTAMRRRSLQDTLYAARISYRETQALVARSRGKPYLPRSRSWTEDNPRLELTNFTHLAKLT